MPIETQSAFARRRNVSKQRVAQYVKTGLLDGAALVAQGGRTMIDVDEAARQLVTRLDRQKMMDQCHRRPRNDARRSDAVEMPPPPETLSSTLLALLYFLPSAVAWSAIHLGAEPWLAHALSDVTKLDITGVGRLQFGVEIDPAGFDPIDWQSTFDHYGITAPVDVKAWQAEHQRADDLRDKQPY